MRMPGAITAIGGALLLTATAAYADPVRPGEETGLGVLPASTPDVLKEAKAAPYSPPEDDNCESIAREIAELDGVLGPDADATQKKGGLDAGKYVGQAVRSLIPYRAVVRMVTGADRKARERNEAAMAGWARRGYLKGMQASLGCPGATAAPPPPGARHAAAPSAAPPDTAPASVTPAAAEPPVAQPASGVALVVEPASVVTARPPAPTHDFEAAPDPASPSAPAASVTLGGFDPAGLDLPR